MKENIKSTLLIINGLLAFTAIGQLGVYSTFVIIMFFTMWFKMNNKDKEIEELKKKLENEKCWFNACTDVLIKAKTKLEEHNISLNE